MSMSVMYAGTGYRYLLGSVAAGDGDRDLATPLTRYYTEKGTPPGRWLGTGLACFDEPGIATGAPVTEQQLEMLIGHGVHPTTGDPLGRRYPVYQSLKQRVARRVDRLDKTLVGQARVDAVARIEQEEKRKDTRRAVAGYDFTFSAPKTVSVLWGLSDAGTQQIIAQAHHDAVAEVLSLLERRVAATRKGVTKPATPYDSGGAIVQTDVAGVSATAYDHYDSRASDPQLHTHVVISNKVMTLDDGKWRSLDGRPLYGAAVALSEYYNAVLADTLTRRIGVTWEQRARGRDRNPVWELAAVPQELADLFSSRSEGIEAAKDRLIDLYVERHGHRPSGQTIIGLRQQATKTTRPAKTVQSLADLTQQWRGQAELLIGDDATAWASRVIAAAEAQPSVLLRADDIPGDILDQAAADVVAAVSDKRATWRHWNLHAEATRQTMGWCFATAADRETVLEQIVTAAERGSLRLTPAELPAPAVFTRPDGTSRLRPAHTAVFTSQAMLDAEDRLLALSLDDTGPVTETAPGNPRNRYGQVIAGAETGLANRQPRETSEPTTPRGQMVLRIPLNRPDDPTTGMNALAETVVPNRHHRLPGPGETGLPIPQPRPGVSPDTVVTNRHNRPDLSADQAEAVWRIATSGLKLDLLVGPAGAGKTTTLAALRETWEANHGTGSVVGLAPSATAAQVLGEELGIPTENTAKWLTDHDTRGLGFQAGQLVIIDEASLAGTFTLDRITALAADAGAKVLLVGDPAQLQAIDAGGAFNLLVAARDDTPQLVDIHRFSQDWEKTATRQLRLGDVACLGAYAEHGRIKEGDTDAMQQQAYQAWLADTAQGRRSILIADDRATVTALNTQARHDRIAAGQVDPDHEAILADGSRASAGDLIVTRRNDRRLQAGRTGWVKNGDRWKITRVYQDGSLAVRRDGHHRGATVILPVGYMHDHVELGYAVTAHRSQGITADSSHVVVTEQTPRENLYVAMTRGRHANTCYVATDTVIDDGQHLGHEPKTATQVLTAVLQTSGAEPSAHQAATDEHERWMSLAQLIPECQQIIADAKAIHDALPEEQRLAELKQLTTSTGQLRRQRTIAGLVTLPPWPLPPEHQDALDQRTTLIEQRISRLLEETLLERPTWLGDLGPRPPESSGQQRWVQALRAVVAYRDVYGITTNDALGDGAVEAAQRRLRTAARGHVQWLNMNDTYLRHGGHPRATPPDRTALAL